jgi:hypothetical protein
VRASRSFLSTFMENILKWSFKKCGWRDSNPHAVKH